MSGVARRGLPDRPSIIGPRFNPADYGLDVTVAIVAISPFDRIIVSISDKMISFGDISQATDDATTKTPSIAAKWFIAFAGNNLSPVWPIIENVRSRLNGGEEWDALEVQQAFSTAFAEQLHREFVSQRLIKYGYTSIEQFRREGRSDLGENFSFLCRELDQFELPVQFLVYGYDRSAQPHIFEVNSPGSVTEHNLLGYAVIGSGFHMAMASLRRKPLRGSLESTIYRLLEAKFSTETATGVGKATTVLTMNSLGDFSISDPKMIDPIREVWQRTVNEPDPEDGIDMVDKLGKVDRVRR